MSKSDGNLITRGLADIERWEGDEFFECGSERFREENWVEAIRWFRMAAEQGHAVAQCKLGVMHDTGRGVVQDDLRVDARIDSIFSATWVRWYSSTWAWRCSV